MESSSIFSLLSFLSLSWVSRKREHEATKKPVMRQCAVSDLQQPFNFPCKDGFTRASDNISTPRTDNHGDTGIHMGPPKLAVMLGAGPRAGCDILKHLSSNLLKNDDRLLNYCL
eukprot:jgi/Botrbrau1/7071/Bobra.0165s0093.1